MLQGWVSGTGGGISMKAGDLIVMAPSGVQKERMVPEDMFVLDSQGNVVHTPTPRAATLRPVKLSECAPLFTAVSKVTQWNNDAVEVLGVCTTVLGAIQQAAAAATSQAVEACNSNGIPTCCRQQTLPVLLQAYDLRGAGAVMHSHSLNAVMATMLDPSATEFKVTHLEMIKVCRYMQHVRTHKWTCYIWVLTCPLSIPGMSTDRVN